MAMNTLALLIAIVVASSAMAAAAAAAAAADEEFQANYDSLFGWPSFTNNRQQYADLIKRFRCHASVHHVYSCLRLSLFKFQPHNFDLFHPAAEDCCTAISNFRDKCGDFNIAKFETFIFPPLLFKRCPAAGDAPAATTPAPAPAPAIAAEMAADIEV